MSEPGAPFKATICVDFDGCLAQYHGWRGHEAEPEPPVDGARAWVEWALKRYAVVVHTARENLEPVRAWLVKHGFPPLPVLREKPPAILYVDDNACRFAGDWSEVTPWLEARPWWWRER